MVHNIRKKMNKAVLQILSYVQIIGERKKGKLI